MDILQAIIIAIVEGLTEFLPVSSTGHMIIAQNLLGVESTDYVKAFTFIIQFGAICRLCGFIGNAFSDSTTLLFPKVHHHFADFYIVMISIGNCLSHLFRLQY